MDNKTIKKLFFDNVIIQSLLKIPEVGLSLILVPLLVRYLTVTEFGIYSFAVSFVTLFSTLMDFGMTPILTREVSRNKNDASIYIGNAILLRSAFYVIFFLALVVVSIITIKETEKRIFTIIMAFSYLCFPLSAIFSVFYSEFKAWLISAYYVCKKVFFLVAILLTIILNLQLSGIIFGHILSENLSVVIFFILALKFIKPVLKLELKKVVYLLKEALPLFVIISLGIIYTKIDAVMLSFLCSDIEVGIYIAATQLYNFLFFIPAILNSFFFPLFSKYFGQKEFIKIVKTSFVIFGSISLMTAIVAIIISKPAIILLLSKKYLLSINVFKFLCIGIPFAFLNVLVGGLLTATNNQKVLLTSSIISCITNIVGNLLFIPTFRMYGAAATTVATQIIYFCVILVYFLSLQKGVPNEKKNYS